MTDVDELERFARNGLAAQKRVDDVIAAIAWWNQRTLREREHWIMRARELGYELSVHGAWAASSRSSSSLPPADVVGAKKPTP